tara:strand:- start:1928 stop:2392 length:465 start_codon:yes stop_codon:yes gene_type:complete
MLRHQGPSREEPATFLFEGLRIPNVRNCNDIQADDFAENYAIPGNKFIINHPDFGLEEHTVVLDGKTWPYQIETSVKRPIPQTWSKKNFCRLMSPYVTRVRHSLGKNSIGKSYRSMGYQSRRHFVSNRSKKKSRKTRRKQLKRSNRALRRRHPT